MPSGPSPKPAQGSSVDGAERQRATAGAGQREREREAPARSASGEPALPREPLPELPPISGIITTFNEERHVAACIESLLWCDEIVVVDSFSTDRTKEIACSFDRVRWHERTYYGAASQKNWAMDQVRHEWMFILDADERCTPELVEEIRELFRRGPEHGAYFVGRRAWMLGRPIRFSGWQHDRVVRLIRRGEARHSNARVHPKVLTRGPAPLLRNRIEHFMIDDLNAYLHRMVKYGYWGASQAWVDGRRAGLPEVLGRPAWRFFRTYVLQLGVLDGMTGLTFCMTQAFATFCKWSTLWSWRRNAERGIDPDLPEFDEEEGNFWEDEGSPAR